MQMFDPSQSKSDTSVKKKAIQFKHHKLHKLVLYFILFALMDTSMNWVLVYKMNN